jgi:hypothetical protein
MFSLGAGRVRTGRTGRGAHKRARGPYGGQRTAAHKRSNGDSAADGSTHIDGDAASRHTIRVAEAGPGRRNIDRSAA